MEGNVKGLKSGTADTRKYCLIACVIQMGFWNEICASEATNEEEARALSAFEAWGKRYVGERNALDQQQITQEGVVLAKERRKAFFNLIKSDPEAALRKAVPLKFRETLPPEIVNELEVPV